MDCFRCLLCKLSGERSSLYHKGMKKVQEGRYFDSDIIFRQVLHEHPGHDFWIKVHNGVRQIDFVEFSEPPHKTLGTGNKDIEMNQYEMIEISFDIHLAQALDFTRTCMDIAHAYLNQPDDEINTKIAMTYYSFIITYLLEFLHLMILWRSEVGEVMMSQSNASHNLSDNFFAKPHEIMKVFNHVKHFAMFFFASASLSYTMLSIRYIHHLDASKEKLKIRIINNCLELVSSVHYIMRRLALVMPDSPMAQLLLEKMPGLEFSIYEEAEEDDEKSTMCRTESSSPRSKIQSIKGGWSSIVDDISRNKGVDTFFFQLKKIHPGMRIVRELPKNPRVRFLISTKIPRNRLARIEAPTERNSFHYVSVFFPEYINMMPGKSAHFLASELPELFGAHGKFPLKQVADDAVAQYTSVKINLKACGTTAVNSKSDNVACPHSMSEMRRKTCQFKTSPHIAEGVNRYLNLSDVRILTVIGMEELMLVGTPLLMATAYLLEKIGRHERAVEYTRLVHLCANMMYGVNSPEYDLLISLHNLNIFKH